MDLQSINEETLVYLIIDNLSPDLLKPQYRKNAPNKLWGHCYVASEVFYHLTGGRDGDYQPMRMKVNGITHWFLQHKETGQIVDITSGQFDSPLDYTQSRRSTFLTKEPSKRAKKLLEKISKSRPNS